MEKKEYERREKGMLVLALILLAWVGIMVSTMEMFPVVKLFVKNSWYYVGGFGAAFMLYLDIKQKRVITGEILYYFGMVLLGPAGTLTMLTYFACKRKIA